MKVFVRYDLLTYDVLTDTSSFLESVDLIRMPQVINHGDDNGMGRKIKCTGIK